MYSLRSLSRTHSGLTIPLRTRTVAPNPLRSLPFRRTYATGELPRPPPSTPPPAETFDGPSKPREYYHRPPQRDLPPYRRVWPTLLLLSTAGVSVWAVFLTYMANQERLSTSVMKRIVTTIKNSEEVREVLGEAVRLEPTWWLNGDPWVTGSVSMLQGSVDLSFRVKGHKGSGTLYFTSIRKGKGEPWTILRFKIIADNGQVLHISESLA
ncbi:DUF1783-domain-containing protein [Stereum hirsutum FP-91666 SS1]|uniref:DUF1783-domain-containing protein n=1 Tax=Stereum hirsutum (strain FP-91666) TaxID=721885 RepID=UPI000440CAF5|nr:DUF1783-domain-containing protein [Stereum hirsutum FP-91666 SS1]EIM89571.1 DUF1783-domain-containing protein [Stereum hirsutum FP-91666 SS1]